MDLGTKQKGHHHGDARPVTVCLNLVRLFRAAADRFTATKYPNGK